MGKEPLVKKLISYRGSHVAHRSARLASRGATKQSETPAISDIEFETLLSRAKDILNRYSYLFAAESYSTSMVGRDDYKYIFTSVEANVLSSRANHES